MRVTRSIVPNLFTLANLFCGFASIVSATSGNIERAAFLILLAGVFDMLDGVVARLTDSTSEFGVELDSLCDAVSFGVAPSVMLWAVYFHEWNNWGLLLSSLPALAGVLRLARFNVQLTGMEDKLYFRGMPIPAGALTVVSYIVTIHQHDVLPDAWRPWGILAATVLSAGAMVSTIKYDNMPRPTARSIRQRPLVFLVFLAGVVASIVTAGQAVFPFMLLYMVGGAVRHLIQLMRSRVDMDDDLLEEPDPDPFDL
jgi:CDP-diacylglycerol---serine O-phosphatidyltransferase